MSIGWEGCDQPFIIESTGTAYVRYRISRNFHSQLVEPQ